MDTRATGALQRLRKKGNNNFETDVGRFRPWHNTIRSINPLPIRNDENDDTGEDFAALLESDEFQKDIFIPQDSKVDGTIVSIGEEWVFVDIGGKSEGTISAKNFWMKTEN